MFHWDTVNLLLKDSLLQLMEAKPFKEFRLVSSTALSLHLGHRMSVDIDLFTDALYGSIDFGELEAFLKATFPYVDGNFGGIPSMGKSYLIGNEMDDSVKLDLYYTEPFIQPAIHVEGIRIATVEEIASMKVDVVSRKGRKKDFWDLHALMPDLSISDMLTLHQLRHEWTHNAEEILVNFTDFEKADEDFDPICLKMKQWPFIKEDLIEAVKNHRISTDKSMD